MSRTGLPPLYLIADRATCRGRPLVTVIKAAVDGGVRLLQLREKEMAPAERLRLSVQVRAATSDPDVRFLINSDADAAHSVGADGVHLPSDRIGEAGAVRERLGEGAIVGASVHDADELALASETGVDFVTFSPVFQPGSKTAPVKPAGVEALRRIVLSAEMPVYALGGVTPDRTADCRDAGARGVAVMSGILEAEDPGAEAMRYLKAWETMSNEQ